MGFWALEDFEDFWRLLGSRGCGVLGSGWPEFGGFLRILEDFVVVGC